MAPRIAPLVVLAALLPAQGRAVAVEPEPLSGLAWAWEEGQPRTWTIDNEVQMASYLWVTADIVKEARLVAFHARSVLTCRYEGERTRRAVEVRCTIDDFAISGATLEGDRGLLQPILEEMDAKVTGAALQVTIRDDGRVTGVDLEEIDPDNRRESRMQEAMRIIFARSIAGFDLQLPPGGVAEEAAWGQYQNQLFGAPSDRGSQGAGEVAHLVRGVDRGWAIIDSAGRGMVVPGDDSGVARNYFDSRLDAVAVFDLEHGMLRERVWTVIGKPTASSQLTEGGRGVDYVQIGKILYLPAGAPRPDLGPSQEVQPPAGAIDSSIRDWVPLNAPPPRALTAPTP